MRWFNVFFRVVTVGLLFSGLHVWAESEPIKEVLPRILIIGDSISIGYTPFVKKALKGKAVVVHNQGNAEHTGTGLKKIDAWLGDTKWDVIHFNWGLWDLCYRLPNAMTRDKVKGTITHSPAQYEKNLEKLVQRLRKTDARLIWASTSNVPEGETGRKVGDDKVYNEIAARIMNKHGIPINDLNTLSRTIPPKETRGPGDVHFKPAGSKKLAAQVVEFVQ